MVFCPTRAHYEGPIPYLIALVVGVSTEGLALRLRARGIEQRILKGLTLC